MDLQGADLRYADLQWSDLSHADLRHANLFHADLFESRVSYARLAKANLAFANLTSTQMDGVDLRDSDLSYTQLVCSNLNRADLSGARVFGSSIWEVTLHGAQQHDLVISRPTQPLITVDNIEIGQFIYLLLNNAKIRDVIDSITSKVVLLLGRFTADQMSILAALRTALRSATPAYVPVLFDFERPLSQDYIETVSTLAHMARFVLADVTDPKIVLEEVPHIVRNLAIPVQPLLLEGSGPEPVTLFNLRRNHASLLETVKYRSKEDLLLKLPDLLLPLEEKARRLREP